MKGKKTGGRVRGVPNKVNVVLKDLAQNYSEEALKTLVAIMRDVEMLPAARVAAAKEILDRGHGKAPQAITGDGGGPVQVKTTVIHEHLPA